MDKTNWKDMEPGRDLDREIAKRLGYYAALVDVNEGKQVDTDDLAHGFGIFSKNGTYVEHSSWTWDLYYNSKGELLDRESDPTDEEMIEKAWSYAFDKERDERKLSEDKFRPPFWSTNLHDAWSLIDHIPYEYQSNAIDWWDLPASLVAHDICRLFLEVKDGENE